VPNLENLKKRAKTLLKQHRAGHYPVATRLRRGLSRFADLSDKAILAAPFALADALEVLAREEGFSSWVNASRKSKDMPKPQSNKETDAPHLVAAYPQALVADVKCAAEFYREKLGFHLVYLFGEPPFYALVERGGARINLRHVDAPARYRPEGDPDVLTANIPVQGIKGLYVELRSRGVDFAQTLKEQPWGASDFLVRDPDGNLLCFASVVDHAATPTSAPPT
jgi:catechol 2,3-dioxygenase-like lactoylglutathione lyase family enzyme